MQNFNKSLRTVGQRTGGERQRSVFLLCFQSPGQPPPVGPQRVRRFLLQDHHVLHSGTAPAFILTRRRPVCGVPEGVHFALL